MAKTDKAAPKPATPAPVKASAAHKNVHQAILAVMEAVPYVRKTGKVGSGNYGYTYASEADLIGALHDALVANRLTLVPTAGEQIVNESYPSDKGKMMARARFQVTYTLTHADSMTSTPVVVFGEGCDMGDKGASKAMTIAYKYALKQAFCIETGLDPDSVRSTDYAAAATPDEPEPARQSAPTREQAAAPPPPTTREGLAKMWAAAMEAIKTAPNVESLQAYREAYRNRGFNETAVKQLDDAFEKRRRYLEQQPAAPGSNGRDDGPGL